MGQTLGLQEVALGVVELLRGRALRVYLQKGTLISWSQVLWERDDMKDRARPLAPSLASCLGMPSSICFLNTLPLFYDTASVCVWRGDLKEPATRCLDF